MKMANLQVQAPPVNFSNHNKSHSYLSTCEMGQIIPIWFQRVLPNDRVQVSHEVFVRYVPFVFPQMAEVNVKVFTFYTPQISIWNPWKKFMSEKPLNEEPKKPYINVAEMVDSYDDTIFKPLNLLDYLTFPTNQFYSGAKSAEGVFINDKLPLSKVDEDIELDLVLTYQKIWNRYFRDENLYPDIFDEDNTVNSAGESYPVDNNIYHVCVDGRGTNVTEKLADGCLSELFQVRRKAWEKDLFTSALPSPQFGDPVNVPISGELQFDPTVPQAYYDSATGSLLDVDTGIESLRLLQGQLQITYRSDPEDPSSLLVEKSVNLNTSDGLRIAGGNFTINDLRMASAVQRYQESLMRAGHRYEEQMRYQFDQVVPNASLREPELIAASTVPVQMSEITQNSETATTPLGTQAGQAHAYNNGKKTRTKFHAPDHGILMTVMVIVPRTNYMNGLSKDFQMFHRLDYFNPIFEHVGDEPLYGKEVFLSTDKEYNNKEFGYIPRYAREKVGLNKITGEMANTLLRMHMGRAFTTAPHLNSDFITVDEETTNRGFAVVDSRLANHVWFIAKNNVFMRRPMQYNPIPKLL